jgi:hypothetical protein
MLVDSESEQKLTYQTIMYDIRLVQLLLDFIKYLYNLTLKQSAKEHLMPIETHIAKIFKELHIIFRLSCSNNSYNKEMVLKEGASQLLILSLKSRSRFVDVELDTLREILQSNQYAEESVARPSEII